jgi:putative nucleotidyltransferase with HDIG domain
VTEAVRFLNALAQALSALALYPAGHTTRLKALDALYEHLQELLKHEKRPLFSFLGDEVIFGDHPLRELRDWEWCRKLADLGIQRIQFDETATHDELEEFLDEVLARITHQAIDTAEARQMRPSGIKFGIVGVKGEDQKELEEVKTATISYTLRDEAEAVRWIHKEVSSHNDLPLAEAEAVVRALTVAMHGDQQMMLPLLKIRQFDEYTTTHSVNVCTLTMALAEWIGMGARDVRAFGVAGLMHDIGKVKIPLEVLNKRGKFTAEERAIMRAHPVEGARIIITSEPDLDLAAVVAYEHHIMLNGEGYPTLHFKRDCHKASNLVHVADVYDALRTDRPYRDAWPADKVLAYIEERSGYEFDGEIAHAFTRMMREWEPQVTQLGEDDPLPEG